MTARPGRAISVTIAVEASNCFGNVVSMLGFWEIEKKMGGCVSGS